MGENKTKISVCIMLMEDDNVWLSRRSNTDYECGKYEFPSGHIETGETLYNGASRETLEETGVIVNPDDLEYIGCVDNNTSGNHINHLFKTSKFYGQPRLMEGEESDELVKRSLSSLYENPDGLSKDTLRFLIMLKEEASLISFTGKEELLELLKGKRR